MGMKYWVRHLYCMLCTDLSYSAFPCWSLLRLSEAELLNKCDNGILCIKKKVVEFLILRWLIPCVFYSKAVLERQSCTTHIQAFQVASFSFVNKPLSDFFLINSHPVKLILACKIEVSFLYNICHKVYWNKYKMWIKLWLTESFF